jgi:hypothetical protein
MCVLTKLARAVPTATGERERSLIAGSHYGVLYYYRNMAESGVAFRGRVPLVDNLGALQGKNDTPFTY